MSSRSHTLLLLLLPLLEVVMMALVRRLHLQIRLRFDGRSTPFDCLSKVSKVSVTQPQ